MTESMAPATSAQIARHRDLGYALTVIFTR